MRKFLILIALIPFVLSSIECYAGTLVPIKNKKGLWGYVDSDNCEKYVIQAKYDDAFPFSEGLACVKKNGLYGFIDPSGNLIIKPTFDSSASFMEGYAVCSKNGKKGIINKEGETCLPFKYSDIKKAANCLYYEGEIEGEVSVFIIQTASPSLNVMEVQSISKYIDNHGSRNYIKDGCYNILNAMGNAIFDRVTYDDNGFCKGTIDGDDATYIFNGQQLDTKPIVYRFQNLKEEYGFRFARQENGWGLLNANYSFISPDSFSKIFPIGESFVVLSTASSSTLSDKTGKTILENISEVKQDNGIWQFVQTIEGRTFVFYLDSKSEFGLIVNGNKLPLTGDISSIQHIGELTIWQKDASSFGVINKDGKVIWDNYHPSMIMPLYGDYYAIASGEQSNYYLANASGKIYDYSLSDINYCKETGIFKHCHDGHTRYLFLRGISPLSLSDFNYNSFCSFYNLDMKKYGKMNESFKIITDATLTEEPDVPYGTKWLKGSVFSAVIKLYGTWYGTKMWFPKGDLDIVTFISYKNSSNPYEAEAYMNLGVEEERIGSRYFINGDKISIENSADCTINRSFRTITQDDGTVFFLESSSYAPPISTSNEKPTAVIVQQNTSTTYSQYSQKPEEHEFLGLNNSSKRSDLNTTVSVTINTLPSKATVSIDGTAKHSAQLSQSDHHLKINANRYYKPIVCDFKPVAGLKEMCFSLPHQYQQKSQGYINTGYQIGSLSSIGAAMGFYVHNVNIEGCYCYGQKPSENIYWLNNEEYAPAIYSYSPHYVGGKIGYGIIIGSRLRLTPQAGLGAILLNGRVIDPGYSDPGATSAYQVSAQTDLKIDFAITTWLGLYVTPSYSFPVKDSPLYKRLSDNSSTIANYGKGYNSQVGLSITF